MLLCSSFPFSENPPFSRITIVSARRLASMHRCRRCAQYNCSAKVRRFSKAAWVDRQILEQK